jgi:hypothetical protein
MKKNIDNIKKVVSDAIELALGAEELFKRNKKPNLFKRMLAGAKAVDLGYDIVEAFPAAKAEIADLNPEEVKDLIEFVRAKFKSEANDSDIKQAIGVALDKGIEFYKATHAVVVLLRSKGVEGETEGEK